MGIAAAYMVPHPPLIIPEIGRGEEEQIHKTTEAYEKAAESIQQYRPDTIVVISPHQVMYSDYFHIAPGAVAEGDFGRFRAKEVFFEADCDTEFTEKLCALAEKKGLPAGTEGVREGRLDHGTMVPLYFINRCFQAYRLVRVGLSGLPLIRHYELGQCIQETADALNRKTVVIASGDLSHRLKEDGPYGYRAEGPAYDRRVMDAMGDGNFAELFEFTEDFCQRAGECGHRSFVMMAGALDGRDVTARRLSYEGPFGVGYGVCAFEPQGGNPARRFGTAYVQQALERMKRQRGAEDAYVQLARRTIETYVRTGKAPELPDDLPDELYRQRAGVFVSIKEDGCLRGCIGTIRPVQESLAEEIVSNAISASTKDPRFAPIEAGELERLTISVDVLGETQRIDSMEALDVKRYGVIVTKGHRRGLLLPNLDGVDTVAEQVAIARQKAGIGEQETVELERFEVVRHL